MSLRDLIGDDDLPAGTLRELREVFRRRDVPEDIKRRYISLRARQQQLEQQLDDTSSALDDLHEQIKARKRREQNLEKRLIYNEKTGLANHTVLDNDLHSFLNEANSSPAPRDIVVYIIALDQSFEDAKRSLEPSLSDWIIYETGERLKECLPANSRLYHTRETEFVVVMVHNHSGDVVEYYADRFYEEVSRRFTLPKYTISIGCYIGIACHPDHGSSKRSLLRNADIALSNSIRLRRVSTTYRPEMSVAVIEKIELQNSIIKALEEQTIAEINRQFELHYQPLIEIESCSGTVPQGRVVGAEALIRWHHPSHGLVAPDRFIPVAEESGLIVPIGPWALYTASDLLASWGVRNGKGFEHLFVSVNVSPRQFRDEYLLSNIERALSRAQVAADNLRLEITESSIMDDPEDSLYKIHRIREMGIEVSIDDFGTGYSSLSYLKRFPIRSIKLDRTFMRDLLTDKATMSIVKAICNMAAGLGIEVIVEGVEQYEQIQYLWDLGCRRYQGFYFGRAVPEDLFSAELDDWSMEDSSHGA